MLHVQNILKDAVNRLKKSSEVNEMENEKKKGLCGICPDKCWIEATIENGKLVKVEPDKRFSVWQSVPERSIVKRNYIFKRPNFASMVRIGKKEKENSGEQPGKRHWKKAAEGFFENKKTIRSPGTRIICRNQRKRRQDHACNSRKKMHFFNIWVLQMI